MNSGLQDNPYQDWVEAITSLMVVVLAGSFTARVIRGMFASEKLLPQTAKADVLVELEGLARDAGIPLIVELLANPEMKPLMRGRYYLSGQAVRETRTETGYVVDVQVRPIGTVILEVRGSSVEEWLQGQPEGLGMRRLKALLAHEVGHAVSAHRLPRAPTEQVEREAAREGERFAERWGVLEQYLLPQTAEEERPVPGWLLRQYPWLKGAPQSIWEMFWPFPELPPETGGMYPWAIEQLMNIRLGAGTQAEKQGEWTALVLDHYYSGLLSEGEKEELLKWEV